MVDAAVAQQGGVRAGVSSRSRSGADESGVSSVDRLYHRTPLQTAISPVQLLTVRSRMFDADTNKGLR